MLNIIELAATMINVGNVYTCLFIVHTSLEIFIYKMLNDKE
jgi:hypothetical protein